MRYAQIKNGKVINIIVCDSENAHLFVDGFDELVEVGDCVNSAKIGQLYDPVLKTFSNATEATLTPEQLARRAKKEAERAEFEAFKAWKASQQ